MPVSKRGKGAMPYARRLLVALLAGLCLLAVTLQPVQGLAYYFQVVSLTVDVYVQEDGNVSLDYVYVFQNQPNGDPIEYVDIGLPTTNFDLNSISGTVDGQPVERVERNTEVNGFSLYLGRRAIRPGARGEVRAHVGQVSRMLFRGKVEASEPYGSFQFEPNYFGSQYVTGRTQMTVTLHLPPGMQPEEPRWFTPQNWPGAEEPESGYDANGGVYYRWSTPNASASARYTFGAAFPARLVPEGVLLTEVPRINWDAICPLAFCLGFAGFIGFTVYASIVGDRKRKLQYLPPKVSVEGNGIKRGLTAVEAAILMQQPMDKILTMILFAVVKKGAARVVSQDPMKIEVDRPLPEDLKLRSYEAQFIEAMEMGSKAEQRRGLQDLMTALVKSISEKMRGFSRKETVAYYQDIMNKAWQQVEQANTPEMQMRMFDDAMDWTMLDRRFNERTRDTFGPRPVMVPMWWGRYDPSFGSRGSAAPSVPTSMGSGSSGAPQGMSLPNLPGSTFASTMVTGMQSFASNVVGDLTSFTGGVTNKTNPVPKPTYTSSSGGGGGGGGGGSSCACACACAGCACACAGGGR